MQFVIIPFITVIVSAVLTREHVTLNLLIGLVVVITGVIIGALLLRRVEH